MKWSLDINFKSIINPAALSAILESHDSVVTAIQWIHPMNEVSQFKSHNLVWNTKYTYLLLIITD